MSVNRHQPHIMVLPEDDANRQVANGFLLDPLLLNSRIQVLPVAGGWRQVLEDFVADHVLVMQKYANRFMVLLIDLDGYEERLTDVKEKIPEDLRERVFVLGALREPEDLRKANLGSYEEIGQAIAKDCREGTSAIWGHDQLRHNTDELQRLRERVCPFLFSAR
jgi:hypothetical protein